MKLAFDLHGVVMYLMPVMQEYFKKEVGFELIETDRFNFSYPDSYDPRRCGIDIANAIRTLAPKIAKPVHGSIPALKRWRAEGNTITFITASAPSTMDANMEWLDKWLGGPYQIWRVNSQDGKVKMTEDLGITHFVDDRFKTCNELAEHLEQVYLMDAPCNRGRIPKANVTRVRSLRKVFKLTAEYN